jgi:hypothetical protein
MASAQLAPETILARRLEQEALFSQRTGRTALAIHQLEMANLIQPLSQRDQMLQYLRALTPKSKGDRHD